MNQNNQLQPGIYALPLNCKAFVREGKVFVSIKKHSAVQCNRCRDCKHFGYGFITGGGNISSVCKLRPKRIKSCAFNVSPKSVYYAALAINKACDKFELKITEQ